MSSSHNLNELSEIQTKIIIDRVNQTEKNMSILLESIASLNRKTSRTRDRADELSKVIKTIADSDNHNESINAAMDEFSKLIVHLADIEDVKILRIEDKIIGELIQQYEFFCRNAREDVKNLVAIRDREITKRRNIEVNRRSRGTSENEIMLSNIQLSKVLKEISSLAETFEKQKLNDMKEIITNFILIYLKYFSSGLEIFTAAYEIISNIDEKADLEHYNSEVKKINRQFKKHLENENNTSNKFKFMRAFNMFSHSTSNLDRIGKNMTRKSQSMGKKSQSTTSLNSIDSNESDIVKAEKEFIEVDTKSSAEEDESDIDDDSTLVTDSTITEEINQQQQPPKSNVKHTK